MPDDRDPRYIVGAEGYADDIRKRVSAHAQAAPEGPPSAWTLEYVGARYVAAVKAGGRWHGPKGCSNNWPPILVEFADLVDSDARANIDAAKSVEYDALDADPDPDERLMHPTLAEEALRWPMLYLGEAEREAACLIVWARAQARLLRIEPFLRRARMAHIHYRSRFGAIITEAEAFELGRWLARLGEAAREEQEHHVALVARFAQGHYCPTAKTSLHTARKRALAIVCAGLEAGKVRVR